MGVRPFNACKPIQTTIINPLLCAVVNNGGITLDKKELELKKDEEKLKARRDAYVDAINRVVSDSELIKELQAENKALANEVDKYKPVPKLESNIVNKIKEMQYGKK